MDVSKIINIINETYEEVYNSFNISSAYRYAELTFTNGYCYEFFCLLKYFYPKAKLMMSNDKMHCVALIDNNLYDATGLRNDGFNFHVATGCDLEYIYKYYGFFNVSFKDLLEKEVIKNVLSKQKSYVKILNK